MEFAEGDPGIQETNAKNTNIELVLSQTLIA